MHKTSFGDGRKALLEALAIYDLAYLNCELFAATVIISVWGGEQIASTTTQMGLADAQKHMAFVLVHAHETAASFGMDVISVKDGVVTAVKTPHRQSTTPADTQETT